MINDKKIESAYNEVVVYINKEESEKGKAYLKGKRKSIHVFVNSKGNICHSRDEKAKSQPDECTLSAIKKLIETYPTKKQFDEIETIGKSLRPGDSTLKWAVLNNIFSKYDSFLSQKQERNSNICVPSSGDGLDSSNQKVVDLKEGLAKEAKVLKRTRNRTARNRCLADSNYKCCICGFDFQEVYGEIGKEYLEVHHIVPLAKYDRKHVIPQSELVALCSNCHSMIHRKVNVMDVDDLRNIVKNIKKHSIKVAEK